MFVHWNWCNVNLARSSRLTIFTNNTTTTQYAYKIGATYRVLGAKVVDERLKGLEVVMFHELGVLPPELLRVQNAPSGTVQNKETM